MVYNAPMSRLTRQEQVVLCLMMGLLLTGWAVKAWRESHLPPAVVTVANP